MSLYFYGVPVHEWNLGVMYMDVFVFSKFYQFSKVVVPKIVTLDVMTFEGTIQSIMLWMLVFLTFIFSDIINCKDMFREVLCVLHPASLNIKVVCVCVVCFNKQTERDKVMWLKPHS